MLKFRLLALALLVLPLVAQQGGGTISGSVTDPAGAAVSGAQVRILQVDTSAAFQTTTNQSGYYTAPGLAVGRYEVQAEFQGFKRAVRSGITLQVNQNAAIDIVLAVGELAETVEVIAETPLVDTSSATLGQVVENRRVQELPLNGRSALALTLLTAGVVSNSGSTQSGFGDRGVGLSSISINGGPNSMNSQMLDGNNNTLTYVGEVAIPPAVDAVEEFKVQSGTMSAEFGFTAGGAINLVTKSGTNDLHGTGYWFLRNDSLDARNTFAARKLPLRYNQFGGSLGGPIVRNRTFGFFNFEEYLLRRSTPRISTTPIDEWRVGNFSNLRGSNGALIPVFDPATVRSNPNGSGLVRNVFPNNVVPQARFDAITPTILAFWPKPNATPVNAFTQSQNFVDQSSTRTDWTQINFKIDHRFSENNAMFFRYTTAEHDTSGNSIFTDQTVGQNRNDNQVNRNLMVSDTHTFSSSLINNLRIGVVRQFFTFRAANGGLDWPRKLGLPEIVPPDQFPQINFGFGTIGGQAFGTRTSLNWDIQDTLTKVAGNHTIKMGANVRINQGSNQQGAALSGNFVFSGLTSNPQSPAGTGSNLAQFLLGEVRSAGIDRILGNTWVGNAYSFFVQDDWKLTRRLTLNLGLRYDFQEKPKELNDGHINFDFTQVEPITGRPGVTVFAGRDGQPRSFLAPDKNDFAPRFGFAWDILGSGKTVLRGGYGIFYPSIFFRQFFGNTTLFSATRTNFVAAGPGLASFQFANGFPFAPIESPGANAGPSALLGQNVKLFEKNSTTPMTQQWNVSVQQQFGEWLVDVTYAGNKGNGFVSSGYNLNQVDPAVRKELGQALFDQVTNPLAGKVPGGLGAARVTRERTLMLFPQFNSVNVASPRLGNYISHQLQLNVRKRLSQGLLFNLAYTAGKNISDSLATPVDFVFEQNDVGFQDGGFNRALSRSLDPLDVSQRAAVSVVWELPFGPGKAIDPGNAVARRLLGGWQINSVGQMQTGQPVIVSGANNNQATRPDSTGQSAKLDNPTRARWFDTTAFVNPPPFAVGGIGRVLPDVRNPGTINWDLSGIKNTTISERLTLQFRAEVFNFLNHVNYGRPNGSFSAGPDGKNQNANFGVITKARDARVIQFGLKLIF